VLTAPGPEFASGVVSFGHPQAEAIGAALAGEGVIVWSGDRRVRVSACGNLGFAFGADISSRARELGVPAAAPNTLWALLAFPLFLCNWGLCAVHAGDIFRLANPQKTSPVHVDSDDFDQCPPERKTLCILAERHS
jgi:hypothetical protein